MQAISKNIITQGQHGASKAVDYWNSPDPTIYAPEDGTIVSYGQQGAVGTVNDAGLALRMNGANGLHQFAHTQLCYVSPGQSVKRGQAIAKMGYTGYTIPKGPGGAHCHWWILKGNTYTYPPNLINESFISQGGDEVITKDDTGLLRIGHTEIGGWDFNRSHQGEFDNLFHSAWDGKPVKDFIWAQWNNGQDFRNARTSQAATIANLQNALNGSKADIAAAQKAVAEANAKVEEETKKATEAGIKAAELEAERKADTDTGNSFLRWLGNLLRKGK